MFWRFRCLDLNPCNIIVTILIPVLRMLSSDDIPAATHMVCCCMHKGRQYLSVYPSAVEEIGIHTPHIIIPRRKSERLRRLSPGRLGSLNCAAIIAKQEIDGLRKVHIIKSTDEVDSVAADAFVLMKPQVSSDRYLFRAVTPHIFLAGAFELFSLALQECDQVCLPGSFLLLGCEVNIFG